MNGGSVRRTASLVIGTMLGVLLLILAFRGVDPARLATALVTANPFLVALGLLTVAGTTGAKALRWGLLFSPRYGNLRFSRLLSALLIGQMVNSLLPARLGELARSYVIGQSEGHSKLFALGTIVVEKVLDGAMLLLLLALLILLMPLPDWVRIPAASAGLLLAVLLAAILLLTSQRNRILGAVGRLCDVMPLSEQLRLQQRLEVLADSLSSMGARGVSGRLLAWTVAIWVLAALTNGVTLLALRVEAPLVLASLFTLVVIHLGLIVPSSPARIGVFHYLCVLSLGFFGVGASRALAYGFVLHFIVVVPVILAGLACAWRENLRLYWLARGEEGG